jgi:hypothetical protein
MRRWESLEKEDSTHRILNSQGDENHWRRKIAHRILNSQRRWESLEKGDCTHRILNSQRDENHWRRKIAHTEFWTLNEMRICKESSNSRHCSDRCQTEVFSGAQGGGFIWRCCFCFITYMCVCDEMRWDEMSPLFCFFFFQSFPARAHSALTEYYFTFLVLK